METAVLIIGILGGICMGLFIGIFIGTERMRKAIEYRSVGHLRIDRSEPDEPARPFLELKGVTIDTLSHEKFVVLKVIDESYLSRK